MWQIQLLNFFYLTVNVCSDFFDWKHVWESVRAVVRPRAGHGRLYLLLIILSMGLYTFQRSKLKMLDKTDYNIFNMLRNFILGVVFR